MTKGAVCFIIERMKSEKTRIGLLINDTNSDYVKEILEGASSYCEEKKISLFIFNIGELNFSYHPFDYQHRVLTQFCNKANIDGLIVCSAVLATHSEKAWFENFLNGFGNIPIVCIGSKVSGRPCILCDSKPGIQAVLEDLADRQELKRFCVLGKIPGSRDAQERMDVISGFLKKRGIRFDDRFVIEGNFTYEKALDGLKSYWEQNGSLDFDAIVALNDDMAFAALDFCESKKIKVPDQIRVAGFDDVLRARYSRPPLTTVSQDLAGQGKAAVECLLEMLAKKRVPAEISVKSTPVFRESGCSGFKSDSQQKNWGRGSATEWLEKKNQLYVLNDFLISGQTRLNLPKLRKFFKENIERFDISAAALCIYEQPFYLSASAEDFTLPDKAFVYSSFDNGKNYSQNLNTEPIAFNPRETMLPPDLLDLSEGKYFITILSKCENQYGYLVFRGGECEPLVYSMMSENFARLVSDAWEASKAEKAARIQQERAAKLNLISKTDELTGLLNRRGFMELGQQTIDIATVLKQGGMVIFGDMDGLKYINDNFGHDAGDRAIKAEAEILKKNFRASDIVGRLGGDEFVIVAAGLSEPRLSVIRENIEAACRAWNIVHNEGFELSISLGCAPFGSAGHNLEDVMREADSLLYEEKRLKKNSRR